MTLLHPRVWHVLIKLRHHEWAITHIISMMTVFYGKRSGNLFNVFLYQKIDFLIWKNWFFDIKKLIFWYQKLIFWYQKIFSDIKKYFLISKNRFFDIKKHWINSHFAFHSFRSTGYFVIISWGWSLTTIKSPPGTWYVIKWCWVKMKIFYTRTPLYSRVPFY